jgi:hypothetical protein
MLVFSAFTAAVADDSIKTIPLGKGWIGFTKQLDPFDKSIFEVIQISKGDFTFRCNELNMEVSSNGFDGFSYDADLRYMIDGQMSVVKRGQYSTYLGGSDIITDSRYYSLRLYSKDIDAMKAGVTMKVAGNFTNSGWQVKDVSLMGFTFAYDQMYCNIDIDTIKVQR